MTPFNLPNSIKYSKNDYGIFCILYKDTKILPNIYNLYGIDSRNVFYVDDKFLEDLDFTLKVVHLWRENACLHVKNKEISISLIVDSIIKNNSRKPTYIFLPVSYEKEILAYSRSLNLLNFHVLNHF